VRTLSALMFRRKFGSVLDEVAGQRHPITITRANRALVVLVPADDYAAHVGAAPARERRLRLAAERLTEWRRRHASDLGRPDPVALVRESRASR
jgi:prevent-host-death family protein